MSLPTDNSQTDPPVTSEPPLAPLVEKYFSQDPLAAAQNLEVMEEDKAVAVLTSLSPAIAKTVFRQMSEPFAAEILQKLPDELMKEIAGDLEPEKAAGFFLRLPQERRRPYLQAFSPKRRKEIREFLAYPEDSAGRLMSPNFTAFRETTKVRDALRKMRQLRQKNVPTTYLYVVDEHKHLIGIMNVWDMVLADENSSLGSIMRKDVFAVNCFMDAETLANEVSARRYFAVPVVDNENRLLGVVRAENLIDDVQEAASEDIQRMFGAGGDEKAFSPIWFSLKQRLPWLHANLATAFLAAAVVGFFEDIIAKITVLAVFLPVVAGQGGNAGAQSLAVVMRGLVMREIPKGRFMSLLLKESLIGTVNGLIIGLVTGIIAWLWQGNPYLGVVIGLGMIVNLIIAGLSGAGIPLLMKSIGLDPAQCSNIILTTITDVIGFFAFLGFAVMFQDYLV